MARYYFGGIELANEPVSAKALVYDDDYKTFKMGSVAGGGGSLDNETMAAVREDLYAKAIDELLTGTGITTSSQAFSVPVNNTFMSRVLRADVQSNGIVTEVTDVALDATPLADTDYLYCADRQLFYFLGEKSGACTVHGSALVNGLTLQLEMATTLTNARSVSTLCEPAAISSVTLDGQALTHIFDAQFDYLFFPTAFTATKAEFDVTHTIGRSTLSVVPFDGSSYVVSGLFATVTEVSVGGNVLVADVGYTFDVVNKTLTFTPAIESAQTLVVTGTLQDSSAIVHTVQNFSGAGYTLPDVVTDLTQTRLFDAREDVEIYRCYSYLLPATQTLYVGDSLPLTGDEPVPLVATFTLTGKTVTATVPEYSGNGLALPKHFGTVNELTIGGTARPIVFDPYYQKLWLTNPVTGTLSYTGAVLPYRGVAAGGEELVILREIPGLLVTTNGTGEHYPTLLSSTPTRVWTAWLKENYNIDNVVITDVDNVLIYEDYDETFGPQRIRHGFTSLRITPVTPKLPLAPHWQKDRRDDTAFFSPAFSVDDGFLHSASTFLSLDDSIRASDDGATPGKKVWLGTDTTSAIRGVAGLLLESGTTPVYYAGSIAQYALLSVYKWFVCKVSDPKTNEALAVDDIVLLCVCNTQYESRAVSCELKASGDDIAVEIFKMSLPE